MSDRSVLVDASMYASLVFVATHLLLIAFVQVLNAAVVVPPQTPRDAGVLAVVVLAPVATGTIAFNDERRRQAAGNGGASP